MSSKKKARETLAPSEVKPKPVRPLKPISSYTSIEDLQLIMERAQKLGDTEYADMASQRLRELMLASDESAEKTVRRQAKSVKMP
jgi:hypothetical protein